jgi:hypothetical protein
LAYQPPASGIRYMFFWLISHQPAVFFSQNKLATSNQTAVLFSQNKPAQATSQMNMLPTKPLSVQELMKFNNAKCSA